MHIELRRHTCATSSTRGLPCCATRPATCQHSSTKRGASYPSASLRDGVHDAAPVWRDDMRGAPALSGANKKPRIETLDILCVALTLFQGGLATNNVGIMFRSRTHLRSEARVWLKIICACLVPEKHVTHMTRKRVFLFYALMTAMPINVGVIIKNVLKRTRVKKGGLLTRFLRGHDIEEEEMDYRPAYDPRGIDVTKTKEPEGIKIPVLFVNEYNARIDNMLSHLYGMSMLHPRMNGVTEEQLQQLNMDYSMIEHSRALLQSWSWFEEPLDDDMAT
ncbi:hypothetical protein HAX54_012188 [Datura stramonium]|uniref:Putative plant transposon protein domain-containing protein n=1 Tax=Datura stramonium TaxID=4076 RepID=A0ABS8Y3X3_DATST|nr:hypothetical protein [Datura stramonium]